MSSWPEAVIFYGIAWQADREPEGVDLEELVRGLGHADTLEVYGHGHLGRAWGRVVRGTDDWGTSIDAGRLRRLDDIERPAPSEEVIIALADVLRALGDDPDRYFGWLVGCNYI